MNSFLFVNHKTEFFKKSGNSGVIFYIIQVEKYFIFISLKHSSLILNLSEVIMLPITRRKALSDIGMLAGVSLLSGCAVNPVTGKRQFMIMSEQKEINMGSQAHGTSLWSQCPVHQ